METKVLIVEDDLGVHKLLKRVLTEHHFKPLSAYNGIEGIQMAKEETPKLILLDIEMPKMDGYSVVRELRDCRKTKKIPIIMVTGRAQPLDKIVGYQLGVEKYITKPFSVSDLNKRINELIAA